MVVKENLFYRGFTTFWPQTTLYDGSDYVLEWHVKTKSYGVIENVQKPGEVKETAKAS